MKIEKEFILREIAGEHIIVPTGETVLQFNGMITVNDLGLVLWELLQNDITEDEMVEKVLEEYEIDEQTARSDIQEFIGSLVKAGIIKE